jgi:two-component system, response regulator PdtaR
MTEKIRVLIVEDESLVAEDLKEMLLGFGYEVPGIADTGEAAIALAAEHRPDLVLMDINLASAMDGITAGGEIRSRWGIPIIYVTAFATPAIIDRAKKTNPSGYILKPFNERQIQTAIEIALYNSVLEQRLKDHDAMINTLINATSSPLILIDRQGIVRGLNAAMAKRAGKLPEQLTGTSFMDLLSGGSITKRLADAVQKAASGRESRFEEELKGALYDNSVIPVPDSRGEVQSVAIFCTDITYLKNAEVQLKAANDQLVAEGNRLATLTAALDSMDDPVIITDATGIIAYVNGAFKTRFGYTLPDVEKKHISTLAAPENLFSLNLEGFLDDQKSVWTGKFLARNKYGLNLPFLLKSSLVVNENRMRNRVFVLREELYGRK